jgi:hypothetical protein
MFTQEIFFHVVFTHGKGFGNFLEINKLQRHLFDLLSLAVVK